MTVSGRYRDAVAAVRALAVRDAMVTKVATVPAQIPLSDLTSEGLLLGGHRSYPVLRAERVVGVLSVGAALALSLEDQRSTSVQAVMTPLGEAVVARPDEPLVEAVARMARRGMDRLLVVDDERLEGVLSLSSVFRHVRQLLSPRIESNKPRIESNKQGGLISLIMTIVIGGIIGWLGLGSWIVATLGAALLIALLGALGVFSRLPGWR